MSWVAFIYADLTFPRGAMDKWRQAQLDPESFDDWSGDFDIDDVKSVSVADTLADLISLGESSGDFVDMTAESTEFRLRGMLTETTYQNYDVAIATALRAAAAFGAEGNVYMADSELMKFAWHIDLSDGQSELRAVAPADRDQIFDRLNEEAAP